MNLNKHVRVNLDQLTFIISNIAIRNIAITSGQSYKASTIVNYDSGVVPD